MIPLSASVISRLGGSWGVPSRKGIVFGEPTDELPAHLFIEEHVEKVIRARTVRVDPRARVLVEALGRFDADLEERGIGRVFET